MPDKPKNVKAVDVPGRERVEVITSHINADFDALASMLAASKLYPDAVLVFPGSQEKGLRNFFIHTASYVFNSTKIRNLDLETIGRLILVDTRQRSRIGRFAQIVDNEDVDVHIYDHHPDSDDDIHGSFEVIREVGAATSLITEILAEKGLTVSPDEASIMCLGIHEDTGSFTFSSTRAEDYRAAAWLTEKGADHNLISDLLTRELTAEQVRLLNDLMQEASTLVINGVNVVISEVIRDDYVGDLAVLVHKFMDMENLDVIFTLAQMEDKIYLVARSRIEDVNAAEIALAFGGGGHPQAASATIKNKTLIQARRSLHALLRSRINPRKTARDVMASPVIQIGPHETIQEAASVMTRYNINVLMVGDEDVGIQGYITRQVVEKAVYFHLGDLEVQEYMNIEFSSVGPDASLKEVQDLIIKDRLRILPVMDGGRVIGVITRTDLLNILVGEPVIRDFTYESRHASQFIRKKNMASMLKERLPRKVIARLKEFGKIADLLGCNVYLVGGLVRDVFLKRENLDVDLVVEGDGILFARTFSEQHDDVRVRMHHKFGTAVVVFPDGFKVDIATARMEYYESPAAPPIVETSSLKQDLFRRDFTMNTLAVKLNSRHFGTLVDYFGAQKDLKERVIRVLHNLSFVEDPTRVLRAIRFEQRFGFKIGKLTLALMKNAVSINTFKDMSPRRLFLELKLLMMEKDPVQLIERMDGFSLLQLIHPKLRLTDDLLSVLREIDAVLSWYDRLYLDEPYAPWKVYWLGLTSSLESASLIALAQRAQISEQEGLGLVHQRRKAWGLLDDLFRLDEDNLFGVYTLLSDYDCELILYLMAKANNRRIKRQISLYFSRLRDIKTFLQGRDLKALGIPPGPVYREILDRLLEARMNGRIHTRDQELSFVLENYSGWIVEEKAPAHSKKSLE
ncbi:MAG: CBS domain-containing protein [Thermodesulfobacteriota bacterium]